MAKSFEGKFDNIFKLLSQHYSQLNVKDKFKCVKCKHILINACATTCGCRFCRECVNKIMTSGCENCPGNTENCKSENLSNIAQDHVMNIKISKLLVKCPEQMCEHECQLIEIEEHMRLCSKKPVQCPCHDLGCNDDDLVEDKINEHLQKESFNHWTMLMGLIGDLRNEVAQLRKTGNVNKNEIEMLKNEGRVKDERNEEMRTEMTDKIRKCEVETEMLKSQLEIGKDNSNCKIKSMTAEINKKIESIKMEKAESGDMNGKLEGIRVELNLRLDETRRECLGHVEEQIVLINGAIGKYQEQMTARLDEIKIGLDWKIDGTRFVWPVDKIPKIGWSKVRFSEFFSPKINPYKIKLEMLNLNSQLEIWLRLFPGANDENLQWPFQAKVRVKVTNKAAPGVSMKVTKYCNISRPPKDSCSSNSNNPFHFQIVDLSSKNLLLGDCCIVECFVDLK